MAERFLKTYFTPEVLAAQAHYYGHSQTPSSQTDPDPLGADEAEFIARRDSFYLATVTRDGWPYVQHRGGPAGFLKVLDAQTLGFADFKGNRQLLSTGNLAASDRVALFLMDYPQRTRLKILGHARVLEARENHELTSQLTPTPELRGKIERLFLIQVLSFDWNCPQYITPRFTVTEVETAITAYKQRIAELEAELAARK
jgi:predicted pyridoxine 5'-phosphate oxidase superfamily flavin-nucleotide-binding protein